METFKFTVTGRHPTIHQTPTPSRFEDGVWHFEEISPSNEFKEWLDNQGLTATTTGWDFHPAVPGVDPYFTVTWEFESVDALMMAKLRWL